MRREKRYIYMDSTEHRLAIVGMNHFRNHLIQTGKPTEDVDALLLKLLKGFSFTEANGSKVIVHGNPFGGAASFGITVSITSVSFPNVKCI